MAKWGFVHRWVLTPLNFSDEVKYCMAQTEAFEPNETLPFPERAEGENIRLKL